MVHYGMTKPAFLAVTRGYARAAAGTGVTIKSAAPSALTAATSTRSSTHRAFYPARRHQEVIQS
jgi:hypothetical protein